MNPRVAVVLLKPARPAVAGHRAPTSARLERCCGWAFDLHVSYALAVSELVRMFRPAYLMVPSCP